MRHLRHHCPLGVSPSQCGNPDLLLEKTVLLNKVTRNTSAPRDRWEQGALPAKPTRHSAHSEVSSLRGCLHGSEPHTWLLVRTSKTSLLWLRHVLEHEATKGRTGESARRIQRKSTPGAELKTVEFSGTRVTYHVSFCVTLAGKSQP